ncbi:asparagine synthase (glutamine-hydrolyzing) [Streptomyces sp. NBC_01142]|uniref:asparagine synthase (glutamine-hydrolyzing) n=1 Tax=Streptomyces sp. NBC_01142 TaxID=2975865 RepID=UPI00224DC3C5|nr:asparagine synthase (glutamine-hydrolyzing) [Streptomyces sp. NBC_01142]MCX4824769.1 asparagine synthase (glutamine-hydrolyzing) [Streptomyces sp. NBC_01142]MCX4827009.1 asparagine synthase (glutamine-hydrolyzing) [Streptomyces sp. NBC_01142]MCX4827053.1 asparagine synthase (glutamine-hydrolyzing) [Streptomyces sp. NBC_01142]
MCGVCGTFSPNGGVDRSIAAAMHSRLIHRGPDETYSLNTETISAKLGRLGFTGLTDGWQPAEDRSGRYVAMTNGEVFNARDLRARVGADRQNNGVDVSVIPELVAQYGIEGLRLVDGQFATVVLDRAENAMFLARDRFGICPMYYTATGPDVHFASEIKPLVQCVSRSWKVDMGAVDQYFSMGNIVAPRTLVKEVQAVPPGCAVRFDASGRETLRYWRYGDFAPAAEPVSGEALREGLQRSVRDRLHADVEIGAYLSGGFDSTAILTEAVALTARPVRTFSVVFDDPGLDEGRFQREVAQAVGSKHEQILCRQTDIASKFEQMVRHCCYPQRETYNVAAMMLADSVRFSGIKGVVSGEGADELFFGYDSYAFDSATRSSRTSRAENERAWGRADFSWEVDWRKVGQRRDDYLAPVAQEALEGDEFWRTRLIPFSEDEVKSLSPMQLRSIADVYVQLSGHLLGDHGDSMLMGNSIEGRYPFLGNAVVSLALQVEDSAKVVDFEGKACLKSAYEGIVPDSVLRRGKHGFTAYDLRSVTDARTWDEWRGLVEASGIFTPGCLGTRAGQGAEKWDFRLSAISIAMVMDELGLGL